MEGLVGGAVFIRCFVDRHHIGEQVMDKLGNGFTRAPFAAVVVRSPSKLGRTTCIMLHLIRKIRWRTVFPTTAVLPLNGTMEFECILMAILVGCEVFDKSL